MIFRPDGHTGWYCVLFMAQNNIREIVGVGTIVNACCNGPFIQFFREKLVKLLSR